MSKSEVFSALPKGLFLSLATTWALASYAGELPSDPIGKNSPAVAPASNEGEQAIKSFVVTPGFKVDLVAAEPHLANPVAFYIDYKGRYFVCETFRLHDGVTDIRGKNTWLDEDLAARTVNDRLAMMKRHVGDKIGTFSTQTDRLKLIEDRDGDGKADHSTVFATGFTNALDGIASGVIARNGNVWYANIPNLWQLRDTNNDGVADERKSLHYGFGVRVGFLGHDLHGLCFGPDGKLYFSIGDRGSNVRTSDGRQVGQPDSGAVFRCNPDGSELEVYAYGLRNPQELAFDQYGNLFTGDNNSDGGDRARIVHVVEGGDSGWRIGYQFIESPNSRGPWNAEKLWHPQWDGQAAYLVPPITNISDGPSGFTYYPGTGMPDRYNGHFFLCDFHGGKGSGIHSFALKPKGASYELVNRENFFWEGLPTDVDFGVDGGIYYTDWVQGWGKTGKGRIYRIYDPEVVKQPIIQETKKLLAEGMEKRPLSELAKLLAHRDMRVRQEAQFALANQGRSALDSLAEVARNHTNQFARLHAVWGIGQVISKYRQHTSVAHTLSQPLVSLIQDQNTEVRAQATKVIGDCRLVRSATEIAKLLQDSSPRVRFQAAIALGKLGRRDTVPAILAMVRDNADQDPYLRHAAVMGLTGINDMDALWAAANDSSPAVRMAILLTLRRLERPEIAHFLNDSDPKLVAEAARAINDQPITGATAELAALITHANLSEPVLRRVLNANLRLGTPESAKAMAAFASKNESASSLRQEALLALADWPKPSGRDRVTGLWRPVAATRSSETAAEALKPALSGILQNGSDAVRMAAIKACEQLQINESAALLFQVLSDTQQSGNVRAAALRSLGNQNYSGLKQAVEMASGDSNENVRKEATRWQAKIEPSDAIGQLQKTLENGSVAEQQVALATLGGMEGNGADQVLSAWMAKLLAGQVKPELQLDVLEAARKRQSSEIKERLSKYESSLNPENLMTTFAATLQGGDAKEGQKIFVERAEAACFRCHKVKGEGGEVGPDLSRIGQRPRDYILESIILPNKQIAPGFENIVVTLKSGLAYAGVLKSENDAELVLNSPEDGIITIKKADIESRDRGISGMPEGIGSLLSMQDIRNLVEFLAQQK